MQSQHAITFSYVVTLSQHRLSKLVSKTDAVKLIVILRCFNPSLSALTCLLPMHTQGNSTAHFRPLMDQFGVRHGLNGFSSARRLPFKRHSSYPRLQDEPRILVARETANGASSLYRQVSTDNNLSLINLDEVNTRCVEEFAKTTINDIEKRTLECRSAEA